MKRLIDKFLRKLGYIRLMGDDELQTHVKQIEGAIAQMAATTNDCPIEDVVVATVLQVDAPDFYCSIDLESALDSPHLLSTEFSAVKEAILEEKRKKDTSGNSVVSPEAWMLPAKERGGDGPN